MGSSVAVFQVFEMTLKPMLCWRSKSKFRSTSKQRGMRINGAVTVFLNTGNLDKFQLWEEKTL